MKLVTTDSLDKETFVEELLAENVNPVIGAELVKMWNHRNYTSGTHRYIKLVEDSYELHNQIEFSF